MSKSSSRNLELNISQSIPWTQYGYYLPERPSFTFDPLFHAGCYYVQEASSMFLEQVFKQTVDLSKPLKILDLSAAPGGKSTHIESLITSDSLLVSNEVIRSRAKILEDNIIKWGCKNIGVTNNDPKDFERLTGFFDVILVDAPCSGSGLFRKDVGAIKEWSVRNVQHSCQRQQRILADIWPALKEGGILIYATCSYSREEDEDILEWLVQQFAVRSLHLAIPSEWGVVESGRGYRFWPDKVKGEGFFISVMMKTTGENLPELGTRTKLTGLSINERKIVSDWIDVDNLVLLKNKNEVYAWPAALAYDMQLTLENLRLAYSGVKMGEILKDKLIPDHALAMSDLLSGNISRIELNYEQAISYLRKETPDLPRENTGWQIVCYQDHPLGWINILPGRINNYYPKELRILKER